MIVLKLLIWPVIIIGFNIFWHLREIRNKNKPDYVLTWVYRGIALILFAVWLTPGLSKVVEIDYFLPIFAYCASTYILIYNPTINALKHKYADVKPQGFWYLGKTSGFFWDGFWNRNLWLYKVIYFGSIPALLWALSQMHNYGRL